MNISLSEDLKKKESHIFEVFAADVVTLLSTDCFRLYVPRSVPRTFWVWRATLSNVRFALSCLKMQDHLSLNFCKTEARLLFTFPFTLHLQFKK